MFHISEEPGIKIFNPRPSPQFYDSIKGDVVFAISDKLLHNYLMPRDCPRVTYYKGINSSEKDIKRFFGDSKADYIINVESAWKERIRDTKLYKYEFSGENFTLLDETAGYFISYKPEVPAAVTKISDAFGELGKRNIELRFLTEIQDLAKSIGASSLNFSIIRMKNSKSYFNS